MEMAKRFELPVLPLRDTVVYPGVAVPISAGRAGTVEAVQDALDGDRRLFAVAQRENVDEADPGILYTVGTVVRVIQTHRVRGGVQLLIQGEERAEAVHYDAEGDAGMLRASLMSLTPFPPRNPEDPAFQALDKELRDRAAELGTRRGVPAEALNQLSPSHREVLRECFYEGRSVAEAAARLGVPPGTVKSRTHYALRSLRLVLEEAGVIT
jgi:ATP-dependent Lon protease